MKFEKAIFRVKAVQTLPTNIFFFGLRCGQKLKISRLAYIMVGLNSQYINNNSADKWSGHLFLEKQRPSYAAV